MTRPIRVLELRSVVGSGGGPEKTILQGTARTDRTQFAVTVCYLRDGRDQAFDLHDRAVAAGIDYVEIVERRSFDWQVWAELKALVGRHSIDVVHAHDYKTDLLAWLLSRQIGILPLATAHGWTGHSWRERMIYYPADRRLLRRFPHVVAVSKDIRDALLRAGSDSARVTVLPNGIDARIFRREPGVREAVRERLGLPASAFVVGSVGRLEPQKRFDLLMEAVALLRAAQKDVRLFIAGVGTLQPELSNLVQRLSLEGSCTLLGHVHDVKRLHHAFDVFVQSSDYEGTSNAVLEAMAMETPVVATKAGGTAELIDHGVHGLLVPCGSAALIAECVARLLDEPVQARQLSLEARRRVEGPLSFETRMNALEDIYRRLVENRGNR